MLLENYKLGIEHNGLYWHSNQLRPDDYHINKLNASLEQNYYLFQFFEDEAINYFDVIKSMISNKLGIFDKKINVDNCYVNEILNDNLIKEFLENNHIKGYFKTKVNLGLYYNDELVSIMSFKKIKNGYEIIRFCNKIHSQIINSEVKLFDYFKNKFSFDKVITFIDRRYSNSEIFENINFKNILITKPNFWYVNDKRRITPNKFKDDDYIIKKRTGFILPKEQMFKIYDCGEIKYVYTKKATN